MVCQPVCVNKLSAQAEESGTSKHNRFSLKSLFTTAAIQGLMNISQRDKSCSTRDCARASEASLPCPNTLMHSFQDKSVLCLKELPVRVPIVCGFETASGHRSCLP